MMFSSTTADLLQPIREAGAKLLAASERPRAEIAPRGAIIKQSPTDGPWGGARSLSRRPTAIVDVRLRSVA
jgi:hypothetical protein